MQTFPRVQHLQIHPLIALDLATLEDLLQLDFVKSVRLGGMKQCVEIIIRRRPPNRAQRRKRGTPYVLKRRASSEEFSAVATKKMTPVVSWDDASKA